MARWSLQRALKVSDLSSPTFDERVFDSDKNASSASKASPVTFPSLGGTILKNQKEHSNGFLVYRRNVNTKGQVAIQTLAHVPMAHK